MKKKLFCLLVFSASLVLTNSTLNAQKKTVVSLNHIAVYVTDLQRSTAFYKNIVGLDSIPEPFHDNRHTWFKIGEHSQLHLIQGLKTATEQEKNTHLCFSVHSVEEFVKLLIHEKIAFEDWPGKKNAITTRIDGVKQIYLQDPDNYWVEINDDKF